MEEMGAARVMIVWPLGRSSVNRRAERWNLERRFGGIRMAHDSGQRSSCALGETDRAEQERN